MRHFNINRFLIEPVHFLCCRFGDFLNPKLATMFRRKALIVDHSSRHDNLYDQLKIADIFRTVPTFQILVYFLLIPLHSSTGGFCSRLRRVSPPQFACTLFVLGFLFCILIHDVIHFFIDSEFWAKYFRGGNRIVSLLIQIRYILIFWKNASTVFLFGFKSRHLRKYMVDLNLLVTKLDISRKCGRRHFIIALILYLIPFLLKGIRVAISAYFIAKTEPYKSVTFGFLCAPVWAKYTFYFFAEILGGILAEAVFIQISGFARILKICCGVINDRIEASCSHHLSNQYQDQQLETFLSKITELRCLHEELIEIYNQHEELFSFQILAGVLNNAFILFSSLASFFAPNLRIASICVYSLSLVNFLYIMFLLPFFPIQLSEEVSTHPKNSFAEEILI